MSAVRGIFTGVAGLAIMEALLVNGKTAAGLGKLGQTAANATRKFISPAWPAVPDLRTIPGADTSQSGALDKQFGTLAPPTAPTPQPQQPAPAPTPYNPPPIVAPPASFGGGGYVVNA